MLLAAPFPPKEEPRPYARQKQNICEVAGKQKTPGYTLNKERGVPNRPN